MSSSSSAEQQQDAFRELEHTNWQRGVDAYDKGFGPLTSQAVPELLKSAGFEATSEFKLLDVACGPGQVLSAAMAMGSKEATYTGLDFSSNFLDLCRKNTNKEHPGVHLILGEGDAQELSREFPTQQFDAVACNFGILHLSDPDAFLVESFKVLKPGGKLAFSAWQAPPNTEGFDLILATVRDVGNPSVELPEGPPFFRFADFEEITRSLEAAGFVDVKTAVVESMEWANLESSDQLYNTLLEGTARTRELLKGQTQSQTEAIQKELNKRYQDLVGEFRRPLRMPAVISSGRKPL